MLSNTAVKISSLMAIALPAVLIGGEVYSQITGQPATNGFIKIYSVLLMIPGNVSLPCCFCLSHRERRYDAYNSWVHCIGSQALQEMICMALPLQLKPCKSAFVFACMHTSFLILHHCTLLPFALFLCIHSDIIVYMQVSICCKKATSLQVFC